VLRIRIIPLTIAFALLFMIVKIVDVVRGTEALSNGLLIPKVEAEANADAQKATTPKEDKAKSEEKAADAKPDDKNTGKDDAKKDDTKKDEGKKDEAKKEEGDKKEAEAKEGDKKEGDKKEGEGDKEKDKRNPHVSDTPGDTVDRRYNSVEMELLENLGKRRDELDRWDRNIQIKEEALNATEKRIDDKIVQIDAMKKEVAALLAQYNEKEDAKIRSLVKIYENMKAKDAARIFDEVEMPILLIVIDKMSEKKAAPILAEMDPRKAKQITVELAEQRRVSSARLNTPMVPKPPAP
jgi:flagellar motility protein MotE (MotC chaperone)